MKLISTTLMVEFAFAKANILHHPCNTSIQFFYRLSLNYE
ncbi:hypothetical protein NMS_1126 [Nonlabens marinus S1-08]|uniref:Uncharacterized protein n=1 Tax=Nonlabens marinus S1-08 TaxID=1454201 RepID=W8VQK7_9FLAO|nr:hypothetical protein NMS_1126 [Nonlabens marinus S1-08]